MTRWVAIFRDTPEMLQVRARQDLRDAHVAFAKKHPELLIGGGLKSDPEAEFSGALWLLKQTAKQLSSSLFPKIRSIFRNIAPMKSSRGASFWRIKQRFYDQTAKAPKDSS